MVIELSELKQLHDFETGRREIQALTAQAVEDPKKLLLFLARYTAWNAGFGAGVSSLAAKIARSRLFWDPKEPVRVAADRNVLVASYFFDAARDEFDDRTTIHRDTHRCLAQALMKGLVDWSKLGADEINQLLDEPLWLSALCDRVPVGYGRGAADDAPGVFRAMGYHLGSELLADEEFTVIDSTLRSSKSGLVEHLEKTKVSIQGESHSAYLWIKVHSGGGGAAEAHHFEWAMRGVRLAFELVEGRTVPLLREELLEGFSDFARDHARFFEHVLE